MKYLPAICLGALMALAGTAFGQPAKKTKRAGDLRAPDRLQVGDPAPDFKLKTLDGKREVQLSSFKGKRPVILVFGSYT